jgi:hypothetical protein
MNNNNYFNRLLVLLLLTLVICVGLYQLPDTIFKQKIKKVDLFADIREDTDSVSASLDSLRLQLEASVEDVPELPELPDTSLVALPDTLVEVAAPAPEVVIDPAAMLRDSIYRVMRRSHGPADAKGERIEDYADGHNGLRRFFTALRQSYNRPVRIAFMGDSFIEGDIIVADFRNALQKQFGGHGVGFVPVTSVASLYRSTIDQQPEGWKMYSIVNDKRQGYSLSGLLFETEANQSNLFFRTTRKYATLQRVNSLKFLYDRSEGTHMRLVYNASDTIIQTLPPSYSITQYELNVPLTEGNFTFINTKGFRALGLALEDNTGIIVDNYSLRGNSGLIFEDLDPLVCHSLQEIRPYDLIILQYGLNAMDEKMLDYGWYGARMTRVIKHIQHCFPQSDLLLISVPDRANQYNGTFSTMPAVLALLHTQRQIARSAQIPFWNLFGAMGGENSMIKYVEKGWAGKDYTHLTFRGGREIARSLMNALMLEKKYYDEKESSR